MAPQLLPSRMVVEDCPFQVSSDVHASGCVRGELSLTDDEVTNVQQFLEPYGYCFALFTLASTPTAGSKKGSAHNQAASSFRREMYPGIAFSTRTATEKKSSSMRASPLSGDARHPLFDPYGTVSAKHGTPTDTPLENSPGLLDNRGTLKGPLLYSGSPVDQRVGEMHGGQFSPGAYLKRRDGSNWELSGEYQSGALGGKHNGMIQGGQRKKPMQLEASTDSSGSKKFRKKIPNRTSYAPMELMGHPEDLIGDGSSVMGYSDPYMSSVAGSFVGMDKVEALNDRTPMTKPDYGSFGATGAPCVDGSLSNLHHPDSVDGMSHRIQNPSSSHLSGWNYDTSSLAHPHIRSREESSEVSDQLLAQIKNVNRQKRTSRQKPLSKNSSVDSTNDSSGSQEEITTSRISEEAVPNRSSVPEKKKVRLFDLSPFPNWREACLRMLNRLKALKASQWFMYPVEPELDGVPDYLDIIKNPIDFQTIEAKMRAGSYPNPYLWQQDVRQIFYNAFVYHSVGNDVWRDAMALALEFEAICREVDESNILGLNSEALLSRYAIFDTNSSDRKPYSDSKPGENIISGDSSQRVLEPSSSIRPLPDTDSRTRSVGNVEDGRGGLAAGSSGSRSVTLDYDTYNALIKKASSSYSGNSLPVESSGLGSGKWSQPSGRYSSRGGDRVDTAPAVGRKRGMSGEDPLEGEYLEEVSHDDGIPKNAPSLSRGGPSKAITARNTAARYKNSKNTSLSRYTQGLVHAEKEEPVMDMSMDLYGEPPVDGPVLPALPVQKVGINDKALNRSQRRLLDQNMSKLNPQQRKAALELIQDDLGIFAVDYMNDSNFVFDTELLSIEKQKRIFSYVNSMVRANKELLLSRAHGDAKSLGKGDPSSTSKSLNDFQKMNVTGDITDMGRNLFNYGNRAVTSEKRRKATSDSSTDDSETTSSSDDSDSSSSSNDSDDDSESENETVDGLAKNKGDKGISNSFRKMDIGGTTDVSTAQPQHYLSSRKPLPEYMPIAENAGSTQIREELMGKHADFLGKMDSVYQESHPSYLPNEAKSTAWPEWKGQVIQQGILSQRQGAPARNESERIAEGYDARI